MRHTTKVALPVQWRELLAIDLFPDGTPIADDAPNSDARNRNTSPRRNDQRAIAVNFDEADDCVWAEVRLCSGPANYYLEAILLDDGHEVDCETLRSFSPCLRDGEDEYAIRIAWEDGLTTGIGIPPPATWHGGRPSGQDFFRQATV